jgi:hypothetical protein
MAKVTTFQALIDASASHPGGTMGVYPYLDRIASAIITNAKRLAPRGNVLDRLHDTGKVGTYKRSFEFNRFGNQSVKRRRVFNTARHAGVVEKGRVASYKYQVFAWSGRGGRTDEHHPTSARGGLHVLERAAEKVAARRRVRWTLTSRVTGG